MTEPRSGTSLPRDRVAEYVRRFASAKIAVLGDPMLDRYFWGDADRISPEAPVPVVRVTGRSARLGGAANVAANLASLGVAAHICAMIGDDREGEELCALLDQKGIVRDAVVVVPGSETTEKVRIIARHQQVVRADFETGDALDPASRQTVFSRAIELCGRCDAIVISDYGKGVVDDEPLRELIAAWRKAGKPVLVDPHIPHFPWYRGATVITPNAREAMLSAGISFPAGNSSARAFEVMREMNLGALLITRGEEGMSLFHGESGEIHIPTVAREVFDVTGAGDTVISVLAAALATGVDIVDGVILSNQAAGEVVKEVGTTTLSADDLINAFHDNVLP